MPFKREYWTTTDGRAFESEDAAKAHEAQDSTLINEVTCCGCGTKRPANTWQCPNIACHEERIGLLQEGRAPLVKLLGEYQAFRRNKDGSWRTWFGGDEMDVWRKKIVVALGCWDCETPLRLEILNYDRQIREEEDWIAEARIAATRREGPGA